MPTRHFVLAMILACRSISADTLLPVQPGGLAWPVPGDQLEIIVDYDRYMMGRINLDSFLPVSGGLAVLAPLRTPVLAMDDAVVYDIAFQPNAFGTVVVLHHSAGFFTIYGHLNTSFVRVGESVKRGEPIALVGNTGMSLIPHLYVSIRIGSPASRADFWSTVVDDVAPVGFLRPGTIVLRRYPRQG